MRVVAVVVSKDQPRYLQKNLEALEKQSFKIDRTLVVDSSQSDEVSSLLDSFVKQSNKHAVLVVEEKASFAELSALAIKQVLDGIENLDDVAIWILHDDSIPEVHSLAELVRALELSPLVGVAGPKQLDYQNPKLIAQLGLTLTRTLKPFSLVNDELDQKQYDFMSDVLAVTSNAMLIRANIWAELGGFSLVAPELAADLDLGIRTHQLGNRVVVVPTSRVLHAELTLRGKRSKKWLGGSVKYAMAKATNHLRLAHLPVLVSFLYWLTLPITSVFQVASLLLFKRPDRILFTLRANFWALFTVRARLRDRHRASLKALKPLFASTEQTKSFSRLAFELQEQKTNLVNFETLPGSKSNALQRSFVASGGLWVMLALLAASYKFFPLAESVKGGFSLPLSSNWLQLFANTGSSYQFVGLGLAAPSDPFNWVLLTIGSLTFFDPNLAMSAVLFLAMPLAYFGFWRLLSTVTPRNSIKIPLALVYVFWPALSISQAQAHFPSVIFTVTLPWLLFSLVRAGRFGITSSVRSNAQIWSWLAASSLLYAVATVSAPSALPILIFLALGFAILSRRRFATAAIVVLPALVLVGPYLLQQVFINLNPLAVFADPAVTYPSQASSFLESVIGGSQLLGLGALVVILLASLALITKSKGIFGIWVLGILAATNLWFSQTITFPAGGTGSIFLESAQNVSISPTPSVMFFSAIVAVSLAVYLDSLKRSGFRKMLVAFVIIGGLVPLALASFMTPTEVSFGESRNLPAIFEAEAKAGNVLRLLVISKEGEPGSQTFRAEIVRTTGITLDAVSTAYRFSELNLSNGEEGSAKAVIAALVGDLVSANGKDLLPALRESGIGFVLVTNEIGNADVAVSLNSVKELDQVGTTSFGQLWRVSSSENFGIVDNQTYWSITKAIQFGVLISFILLALPTSRGRKTRTENQTSLSNSFQEEEQA
jgi:GT2 family glycosyltransferase